MSKDKYEVTVMGLYGCFQTSPLSADVNIPALYKILDELVAAEREECAALCEEYESDMGHGIPQQIADAIRSRT